MHFWWEEVVVGKEWFELKEKSESAENVTLLAGKLNLPAKVARDVL